LLWETLELVLEINWNVGFHIGLDHQTQRKLVRCAK
jgi:hypothetical protein